MWDFGNLFLIIIENARMITLIIRTFEYDINEMKIANVANVPMKIIT